MEKIRLTEEQEAIQPSKSLWASSIVLVAKKDKTTYFCVDYRKLNAISKMDVYPLPRIDDSLDLLSGQQFFTTLDLASGYWQVYRWWKMLERRQHLQHTQECFW